MNFLLKFPFLNQFYERMYARLKNKKTVYIVPNRNGFYFAFIIFTLFLMGLSYGNNVLLFFDFFIFGIFVYAQFSTHYNLYGLKINKIDFGDCYQGSPLPCSLSINNNSYVEARDIFISLLIGDEKISAQINSIKSKSQENKELSFEGLSRGIYKIDRIESSSTYPLGIFYVWKYLKFESQFYVYPKIEGKDLSYYFNLKSEIDEIQEYKEHKKYQERERICRIDWKSYAKSNELKVKEYTSEDNRDIVINFEDYLKLGTEQALSQVCKWVSQANAKKISWEVTIDKIIYTSKQRHFTDLLKAMAVYGK